MIHPSAFAKLMINHACMMLSFSSKLTMSAMEGNWRVQLEDWEGDSMQAQIYIKYQRKSVK